MLMLNVCLRLGCLVHYVLFYRAILSCSLLGPYQPADNVDPFLGLLTFAVPAAEY